jgi:hypothetical protein
MNTRLFTLTALLLLGGGFAACDSNDFEEDGPPVELSSNEESGLIRSVALAKDGTGGGKRGRVRRALIEHPRSTILRSGFFFVSLQLGQRVR